MDKLEILEYIKKVYEYENQEKFDNFDMLMLKNTPDLKISISFKRWLERERNMVQTYNCTIEQITCLVEYIFSIISDKKHLLHEMFTLTVKASKLGVITSYSSFSPANEEIEIENKKYFAYELIKTAFHVFTIDNLKSKVKKPNQSKIDNAVKTLKEYSNNEHLHYYLDLIQQNPNPKLNYNEKFIESSYFYFYTEALRSFTKEEATQLANEFLFKLHEIKKDYRIYPNKIKYLFRGRVLFRYKAPKDFEPRYMIHALNGRECVYEYYSKFIEVKRLIKSNNLYLIEIDSLNPFKCSFSKYN